jgi:hypothetical protein
MYPPRTKRSIGTAMRALNDSHRVVRLYISPGPQSCWLLPRASSGLLTGSNTTRPRTQMSFKPGRNCCEMCPIARSRSAQSLTSGSVSKNFPQAFVNLGESFLKAFLLVRVKLSPELRPLREQGSEIRDQRSRLRLRPETSGDGSNDPGDCETVRTTLPSTGYRSARFHGRSIPSERKRAHHGSARTAFKMTSFNRLHPLEGVADWGSTATPHREGQGGVAVERVGLSVTSARCVPVPKRAPGRRRAQSNLRISKFNRDFQSKIGNAATHYPATGFHHAPRQPSHDCMRCNTIAE